MRRTVATLLVVTSPLLIAAPVGAREGRIAAPPAASPAVATAPAAPGAANTPLPATISPAVTAPLVAPPAVPAPAATGSLVSAPARTAGAAVRPVVRAVRVKAPAPAGLDGAYEAKLRADLCQARAIFCGLDRGGHYLAR